MRGVFGIHRRDGAPLEAGAIAQILPREVGGVVPRPGSPTVLMATDWATIHDEVDGVTVAGSAHLLAQGRDTQQHAGLRGIVDAYRAHGLDACAHLDGQFAFALSDPARRRLLLAVDRFATRPLYYAVGHDFVVFASQLVAFSQAARAALDAQALLEYFLYTVIPSPRTPYRDIRKLEPGSCLVADPSGVRTSTYWRMSYREERNGGATDWEQQLRAGIESTIRRHIAAEPSLESVGAFLSGGTDSSTVAGMIARITHTRPRVFSIGYSEDRYDELAYARTAAEWFNLDHHIHRFTAAEALAALPEVVRYYEEPFGNSSALATLSCARVAREAGVHCLFAGDGGDEIFAGNERYSTDAVFALYQRLPRPLRRLVLDPLIGILPDNRVRRYVHRSNRPNPERVFSYNLLLSEPLSSLLTRDFLAATDPQALMAPAAAPFHALDGASELNRLLHLDLKLAIADNDVRKVSGMADLAGIAVRYPFLDTQLAELTGRIPSNLKLRGREKRYIFKRALADFLPPQILTKPKHGFGVPVSTWMKSDTAWNTLVADLVHDSRTRQRGYFLPQVLDSVWEQHHGSTSAYFGDILWPVLMLELWHREHASSVTS